MLWLKFEAPRCVVRTSLHIGESTPGLAALSSPDSSWTPNQEDANKAVPGAACSHKDGLRSDVEVKSYLTYNNMFFLVNKSNQE